MDYSCSKKKEPTREEIIKAWKSIGPDCFKVKLTPKENARFDRMKLSDKIDRETPFCLCEKYSNCEYLINGKYCS